MKEQFNRFFGLNEQKSNVDEVKNIAVDLIDPSPYQPRTMFDDERIVELCQTIRTHGIIQPIVVREMNGRYEIIAGERRWRAVKKLELATIPAIIRQFNESQAASIALIENLQREGLTPIEEAVAYQKLLDLHSLTQESLAQRLGKSQSTIANKIRLLSLPQFIKEALMERKITERHARAMLSLQDEELQRKVFNEVLAKDLNVKQTEARVAFYKEANKPVKHRKIYFTKDVRLALNTIRQSIGMIAETGFDIQSNEADHEDYYEIVIQIPKQKKQSN